MRRLILRLSAFLLGVSALTIFLVQAPDYGGDVILFEYQQAGHYVVVQRDLRTSAHTQQRIHTISPSHPRWSPDGTQLAMKTGDTLIVNTVGGDIVTFILDDQTISDFAWSPDGNRIALNSTSPQTHPNYILHSVYFIYLDSHHVVRAPAGQSFIQRPVWLDDAIYGNPQTGEGFVFPGVTLPATGDQAFDTSTFEYVYNYSISPDKTRMIVNAKTNQVDVGLYLVDLNTQAIERLTVGSPVRYRPLWSPDGTRLVYLLDGDLYIHTLATGHKQRMTFTPAVDELFPQWRPR